MDGSDQIRARQIELNRGVEKFLSDLALGNHHLVAHSSPYVRLRRRRPLALVEDLATRHVAVIASNAAAVMAMRTIGSSWSAQSPRGKGRARSHMRVLDADGREAAEGTIDLSSYRTGRGAVPTASTFGRKI
jgi:hypothetical protein